MTFDSSNREEFENRTTNESLVEQIRIAMHEGCIRPCHVFDLVDETLDRLLKQVEALKNAHDFLRKYINCSADFKTEDARGLADELWDVIHRGDEDWREVHNWRNK